MDFSISPQAEAFRAEVRSFLAEHVTDEVREVMHSGTLHDWDLHRKIAEKGWLWAGVPSELGGGGRDPLEMAILWEEMTLAGAPYDGMSVAILVACVILSTGNDFLKQEVAHRILDGEGLASLGYSEPESGSDVAAAATRAVRDGDQWVITGQKMWTSLAHEASWIILLTRTNPDVAKHKGLTMFIVPTDTPGIEVQPVWTMGTERTNATFYDEVRLDDKWRLGEVDGGWNTMKVALSFERGVMGGTLHSDPLLRHAIDHASATTRADGSLVIEDPVVRERLARTAIDVEVARLMTYRAAWVASSGKLSGLEGTMVKLFATEVYKKHAHWFFDMAGREGLLRHEEPDSPMGGYLDESWRHAPVVTLYGGTSEISRNMVAEHHLGLPKARR